MTETTTTHIDLPDALGAFGMFDGVRKAIHDPMILGVGRCELALGWRADGHCRDQSRKQLKNGGLLLRMRAKDAERGRQAVKNLKEHSGKDVHVHDWSA